jgi:hypothetical protein
VYSQRWPTETFYQDGKGHLVVVKEKRTLS